MIIARIENDLRQLYRHQPDRLKHIYGVVKTANELALLYGANTNHAEIAALLHDITKIKPQSFHEQAILNCYNPKIFEDYSPPLYHAFSAVCVAKKEYGITNEDILNAIESHTLGRPNMSLLEKIVFISDYVEPNRTYASCCRVRPIAYKDLDRAVYEALNDSIEFHENNGGKVPPIAYKTRDFYRK